MATDVSKARGWLESWTDVCGSDGDGTASAGGRVEARLTKVVGTDELVRLDTSGDLDATNSAAATLPGRT